MDTTAINLRSRETIRSSNDSMKYDINLKEHRGGYMLELDGHDLVSLSESDMEEIVRQYEEHQ